MLEKTHIYIVSLYLSLNKCVEHVTFHTFYITTWLLNKHLIATHPPYIDQLPYSYL